MKKQFIRCLDSVLNSLRQEKLRRLRLRIERAKYARNLDLAAVDYRATFEKSHINRDWQNDIDSMYVKAQKIEQQLRAAA